MPKVEQDGVSDLSPKEISKGLVKAARFLRDVGREESELPLLKAAEDIYVDPSLKRAMFWAAKRDNDVETALDMCRELIVHYAAQPGVTARKVLKNIRSEPIANLTCLDDLEVPARPVIESNKGRLLYVLNYSLPQVSNGYATRGQGLALGMKQNDIDVICLSRPGFPLDLRPPKDFTQSDTVEGVTYLHDPEPILLGTSNMSAYVPAAADVIERRIRELRPQAVMAASNFNNALPALIAARRMGLPFWYEVRGFWEITRLSREPEIEGSYNYRLQRAFETFVASNSDRVFTLTQPMREELIGRGVQADRIELLPNSCDPSRFTRRPYDAALARKLDIPKGVPVIGYVGSFAPYEGLEDLAAVCARLRKEGQNFRLLLVGGETGSDSSKGPVTLEIERIAKEKGLGDWLIMTGRIPHEQVEAYYSLIDIAPFPRRSQPVTEMVSPLKPLEALAMEKAVVVSSLRALNEMIVHDETGLIFEKEDMDSFAGVLKRLLSDKELRRRLGKAGREWVVAERTWSRTAEKVAQTLKMTGSATPFASLIRQQGFLDAEQILYADIDLNTVDGSAIWMSSMASILASDGKTIVISKNPIRRTTIVDNILHRENVLILTPDNTDPSVARLDMTRCIALIRDLDKILSKLKKVVVRGLSASVELLSDRQFYRRVYPYLTDLYEHSDSGITVKTQAYDNVDMLARQSAALLMQTPRIEELVRQLTSFPYKAIALPPPIPDHLVEYRRAENADRSIVRIGYAGKIAPQWGIQQLVKWVESLRQKGLKIEVTIIGDKIAGAKTPEANKTFREEVSDALERIGARRLGALDRASVAREMERMDFAWCWRPASLEDHTLELSTKLVEGVAAGIPCIAYPSQTNKECLGEDYPFFARDVAGFRKILQGATRTVSTDLRERIHDRHSIGMIAERLSEDMRSPDTATDLQTCFATHDPKFIFPYYSNLKSRGQRVLLDSWAWGHPKDEERSSQQLTSNEIIFCEWGLANAVWYSRNLPAGPKLVVRVHLQEIHGSAQRFGYAMNHERVDTYIFVSARVRDEAVKMFGLDHEKTRIIPNFVLEDEYLLEKKDFSGPIRLGMVGIAPMRKRFDRAVKLALDLGERGFETELHVKGQRPENIPFMQSKNRADELNYYLEQYRKIDDHNNGKVDVKFHDWGNNVAQFYEKVDYILSPSDFESFHYALADGVLAGCYPVVWSWDEASDIYSSEWLVFGTRSAAERILAFRSKCIEAQSAELRANRALVTDRYGSKLIFSELDKVLFGESSALAMGGAEFAN